MIASRNELPMTIQRANLHATVLSLLTVTNIAVTILALIGFVGLLGHVWSSMDHPSESERSQAETSAQALLQVDP